MHACMRVLAASALTAALVLTGCTAAPDPATPTSTGSSAQASESTAPAPESPAPTSESTGSGEATGFNQDDVMFAMNMIAHHQQAIEMSNMLLEKSGVEHRVAQLAEGIRAAQEPEIGQMNAMLEGWGVEMSDDPAGTDHDMGGSDGGMMSGSDMELLAAAPGTEASRLFVEQMIMHHEGAVEMAEAEVESGENPDAVALAERVIGDQSSEIAEMEALLSDL